MIWKVMLYDNGRARAYNVFNNISFNKAVQEEIMSVPELTFEFIEQRVKELAQWQFWSRCEYEFLVTGWPPSTHDKPYKLDVYEQLRMNWDQFINYIYNIYCFGEDEDNGT